ncbi:MULTISPECIES: DUF2274 domain-containing protein [unclassified Bradyrhizobium]|uniref:DUF2274 domain-containing protein n=1 Tax=unclassified Bradyrhizobium TaxID=2631580 RepID=UPI002916FB0E|nr:MULTISPECIES: DUF2274 domain-containing protein [unclassified Bradyrhizobium]
MTKLKIVAIEEDRPVSLTVRMPASTHRDLIAYAEILKLESGKSVEPTSLIVPMLTRFMATDRAFARARRKQLQKGKDVG